MSDDTEQFIRDQMAIMVDGTTCKEYLSQVFGELGRTRAQLASVTKEWDEARGMAETQFGLQRKYRAAVTQLADTYAGLRGALERICEQVNQTNIHCEGELLGEDPELSEAYWQAKQALAAPAPEAVQRPQADNPHGIGETIAEYQARIDKAGKVGA